MPSAPDMPGILLELDRIAEETGIEFQSVTPLASAVVGDYQTVPITLAFDGNFYELSDFLFRLRTLVGVRARRAARRRPALLRRVDLASRSRRRDSRSSRPRSPSSRTSTGTTSRPAPAHRRPTAPQRRRQIRMQRRRHLRRPPHQLERRRAPDGEACRSSEGEAGQAEEDRDRAVRAACRGGRLPGPQDAEDDEGAAAGRSRRGARRRPRPRRLQPAAVPDPAAPASAGDRSCRRRRRCSRTPTSRRTRESGQLLSIDSFSTKDPFAQQQPRRCRATNPAPANDSRPPPATDSPSDSGAVPAGTFDPLGSNPQDQDPNAPPVSTTPSVARRPPHRDGDHDLDQRRRPKASSRSVTFPAAEPVFVLDSLARDGKSVADQRRRRQLRERQADDQAADREAADAAEHLGRKPLRPRAPDGRGLRSRRRSRGER